MKPLVAALAVIVVAIVAIALRNWTLVTTPAPVDLVVATVEFPLALLLLIALCGVALFHLVTVGRVRLHAMRESRDLHRELDRARRTADAAELSRVADLRGYLDREIPQIELKLDEVLERLDARGARPPG